MIYKYQHPKVNCYSYFTRMNGYILTDSCSAGLLFSLKCYSVSLVDDIVMYEMIKAVANACLIKVWLLNNVLVCLKIDLKKKSDQQL